MTVSSTRKEFDDYLPRWCLVRDVIDSDVKKYIRAIDPKDEERCSIYKEYATFTNFTSRTRSGLVGAVFRKDPIIELPDKISYLIDDATGYHMPLKKLQQECTNEVLMSGRYGLLADYPASEDGLTAAETADLNLKARIYRYRAEDIINWQVKIDNGNPVLSLVVLKECVYEIDPDDGFEWTETDQYRVLRLVGKIYVQEVYDEEEKLIQSYIPKDANGQVWDYIPFVFIGSEDNDSDIDISPLYDLAKLNIAHYRNSADMEESCHIVGQPTMIISTEMSKEQFDASNPGGVLIGSRRGLNLGINGRAEFLQADPNILVDKAMERKEQQAIMIGARIIVPQADRETAMAAQMRHSGETSILATIANNVEEATIRCCKHILKFMDPAYESQESNIIIDLNDQFFDKTIDPNLIMAAIQLIDKGVIAKSDARVVLKTYGVIDEARIDAEIDAEATPLPVVDPNKPNFPPKSA